eukprot:jgi/Mesvir1/5243/Mv15364-RA.1
MQGIAARLLLAFVCLNALVLVRLRCRPVNPSDAFSVMGVYPGFQPKQLPATPGLEGMGVIEEVGPDVSSLRVGQRVVPLLHNTVNETGGSWQQYVAVRQEDIQTIPESVSDEAAAQFLVNPWTVYGMLRVLAVPKGEWLLQTAAGSVLGRQMIQLAKHYGIKTLNVVRRKEQFEELLALGADACICSEDEDIPGMVRSYTGGKMAYGAVDCVAGQMTKSVAASVRQSGRVLIYGLMGGLTFECGGPDLIFRDIKVEGFWLSHWLHVLKPEELRETSETVMGLLEHKVIEPLVGDKYDLSEFVTAVKKSYEVARGGKILLIG